MNLQSDYHYFFLLRFNSEICPIFSYDLEGRFNFNARRRSLGRSIGHRCVTYAALRDLTRESLEEQGGRDTNSGNKRNKQRNTRELCHSYS